MKTLRKLMLITALTCSMAACGGNANEAPTVFQNGAELNDTPTYSGEAKRQYELVRAFFDKALEGGKITFGKIVLPEDDSPITVLLEGNGETYSTVFQKMEVDIKSGSAPAEMKSEGSDAETVKSALQGTWVHEASGGTFSFTGDNVSINNGDLKGTFTVNLDESIIECTVNASDGKLLIKMPFEYKNNTLTLENNRGERLKKR